MRVVAFALTAALALPGCLAGAGAGVVAAPYVDLGRAPPGGLVEFAVFLSADRATTIPFEVVDAADGWTVSLERESVDVGPEGTAVAVAVSPGADALYGTYLVFLRAGPREFGLVVEVQDVGDVPARAGIGALVRTAGFFPNGTVFYTNMREVRDAFGLRFDDLGGDPPEGADFDPLKVFVGGKRGTPPPEPYNASGYRPVIDGFDARLRGMREGETRFVRIAPEDAYTRPGSEEHVLYGDALAFLIQVERVDDLDVDPDCGLPVCPVRGGAAGPPPAPPKRNG